MDAAPAVTDELPLNFDLWVAIARDWLENPKDILVLASCCRSLWSLLKSEIYATEILKNKALEKAGLLHHQAYHERVIRKWSLPRSPDVLFPAEVPWKTGPGVAQLRRDAHARCDRNDQLDMQRLSKWPTVVPERVPRPSALIWATSVGYVETAREIIEVALHVWPEYLELQHPQSLHQPIHIASMHGHIEIVKSLIDAGCSALVPSENKCLGHRSVESAIQHFAPNLGLRPVNYYYFGNERAPLPIDSIGLAVLCGHTDLAKVLVHWYDQSNYVRADYAARTNGDYRYAHHPVCPLHLAALVGNKEMISEILRRGTDINSPCEHLDMTTPLHWASINPNNKDTVEFLLDNGARIDISTDEIGFSLITALNYAIFSRAPEVAYLLIERDSPLSFTDHYGHEHTPEEYLGFCAGHDDFLDCTKLILSKCSFDQDELLVSLRIAAYSPPEVWERSRKLIGEQIIGFEDSYAWIWGYRPRARRG